MVSPGTGQTRFRRVQDAAPDRLSHADGAAYDGQWAGGQWVLVLGPVWLVG